MEKDNISYIYERASRRIKLFRKYRNMTQEQLSIDSTFSRGFIANIESIKTKQTFSLGVLYYISLRLNIPIELFVKDDISEELKELGINESSIK
ncbi:MAG: helix-turn-helix transcriptional regulator [Clostridia bacterium]|nr:helix-turn-helix transcriptional regulator [Clostridia bacterium]